LCQGIEEEEIFEELKTGVRTSKPLGYVVLLELGMVYLCQVVVVDKKTIEL